MRCDSLLVAAHKAHCFVTAESLWSIHCCVCKVFLLAKGVDQHAAGGKDIFATRTADRAGQAVGTQVIAESRHALFVAAREGFIAALLIASLLIASLFIAGLCIGLVEADEVDAAGKTLREAQ